MKFQLLHSTHGCRRLVLFFTGWGMSPRETPGIVAAGYDTAVVWDYSDLDDSQWIVVLERYEEIVVAAWSYGVNAASRWIDSCVQRGSRLPITARIAINGTPLPVDDAYGIPEAVYTATVANYSSETLTRFHRRMCGGSAAMAEWLAAMPGHIAPRKPDDIHRELLSMSTAPTCDTIWDIAVASKRDAIFPPANVKAWFSKCPATRLIEADGPHLPDFSLILSRCLNHKDLVGQRFREARFSYENHAVHQKEAATKLMALCRQYLPPGHRPGNAVEIGCGTGTFTRHMLTHMQPSRLTLIDLHISDGLRESITSNYGASATLIQGDAETVVHALKPASFDLVASASTMQWFNSPRAFLEQVHRILSPQGVAAIATYGPLTMRELHSALGTGSLYPSAQALMAMLPQGLECLHMSQESHALTFDSPLGVLRHISLTGVGAAPVSTHRQADARALLRRYPTGPHGEAEATYQPIYLILKKMP